MANKKNVELTALIKEIKQTVFARRLTIAGFLVLVIILKFGIGVPLPFLVFPWLIFWFLTSFVFSWFVKKLKTPTAINNVHFEYFIFELLILTIIVHYTGGVESIGVIFYVFTLIYANIFLSKKKRLFVTITAFILYAGLVFLEYFEVISHHELFPVFGLYRNFSYVSTMVAVAAGGTFSFIALATGLFAEKFREKTEKLAIVSQKLEEEKASLEIKVKARTKGLKEFTEDLEEQVNQRTEDLQDKNIELEANAGKLRKKNEELEKFNKLAVGRELEMIKLKTQIKEKKKPKNPRSDLGSNR